MRIVVVDDERLARDEIRRLLARHADMPVVAEAATLAQARQAIAALQPDLVFLDIQMPDGNGFELLATLDEAPPVIFTTAFSDYAMRAFDVNALDYLLKPIRADRFDQALLRVARPRAPGGEGAAAAGKVFIKDGERCWFVALSKIALFESEGNYTRVYFDDQRPLLLRSLNQLELKLDQAAFVRVSRRFIVNMQYVREIAPSASGTLLLTLEGGMTVEMSRRRAAEFRQSSSL